MPWPPERVLGSRVVRPRRGHEQPGVLQEPLAPTPSSGPLEQCLLFAGSPVHPPFSRARTALGHMCQRLCPHPCSSEVTGSRLCGPHGPLRGPPRPAELSGAPTLFQAASRDLRGGAGTALALPRSPHPAEEREAGLCSRSDKDGPRCTARLSFGCCCCCHIWFYRPL